MLKSKSIDTKKQYQRVARQIKDIADDLNQKLTEQIEFDFKDIINEETAFVEKALKDIGVSIGISLPPVEKIWAIATFSPIGQEIYETYDTYYRKMGEDLYKTWSLHIRAGMLTGQTVKTIVKNVLGSVKENLPGDMQKFRRSLERMTLTQVFSISETAREAVYKANSDIIKKYRYLGVLDRKQCRVCGAMDGEIRNNTDDPKLPQHFSCRCLWLPVIEGMEDIPGERAAAGGPVDVNTTWKEWLAKQPDDVVKDILGGGTRYRLWKEGASLDTFFQDGRALSVAEIKKREGID